jgi:hypothetical protein
MKPERERERGKKKENLIQQNNALERQRRRKK